MTLVNDNIDSLSNLECKMSEDAVISAHLLERIGRLIRTEEQVSGLYPAQWSALRYLARANRFSRTPMALAHYLGSTRGTVSQTLIALERKGFIKRTQSLRDKRSVDIDLTASGRELLKSDPILDLANDIEWASNAHSSDARDVLERILTQLISSNDGRPFGQCKTCRHFRAQGEKEPHFCGLLEVDLSHSDSEKICLEQEN
ncbi:MAG: MarR family winged helix-turn-helix transcriptional regulator [Hyphomicrobiaceae bacterium]